MRSDLQLEVNIVDRADLVNCSSYFVFGPSAKQEKAGRGNDKSRRQKQKSKAEKSELVVLQIVPKLPAQSDDPMKYTVTWP